MRNAGIAHGGNSSVKKIKKILQKNRISVGITHDGNGIKKYFIINNYFQKYSK